MPITVAKLAELKKAKTPELRQLASKQLVQARQALAAGKDSTNDISWWQQPLQVAQYARWKPFADSLDESERVFRLGDSEKDDVTKRARYIEAYRTAFATAEDIAKEAQLSPTNFTTLWQSDVIDPLLEAVEDMKKKANQYVAEPLEGLGRAAVVVGGVWALSKVLKK